MNQAPRKSWLALALLLSSLAWAPHAFAAAVVPAPQASDWSLTECGPTFTELDSDVDSTIVGFPVNLIATVTPHEATGSVEFFDGKLSLGAAPVVNGVARLLVRFPTARGHIVTSTYSGDGCFEGSASNGIYLQIRPSGTLCSMVTTPNPSVCGTPVDMIATVTPSLATGIVSFFENGIFEGSAFLVDGVARIPYFHPGPGTHSLRAVYEGDANYLTSGNFSYNHVVQALPSATSLTTSKNPCTDEDNVNVVVTVTPNDANGWVEFFEDGASLGETEVVNGRAVRLVGFGDVGTHVLTATFRGGGCLGPSSSAPYDQVVELHDAVLLSLFEANTVNDGVELRWQFSDAVDLESAWVERSSSAAGPWTAVEMAVVQRDGVSIGTDRAVEPEVTYAYRLVAALKSGGTQTFGPVDGRAGERVTAFALARISPNPMHGVATIEYTVPIDTRVRLSVVDLQGRAVANLVDEMVPAGRHQVTWSGEGRQGRAPAGIYFVRLESPGAAVVRRLVRQ